MKRVNRFSKTSLQRLEGINVKLIELMNKAIVNCPVDFTVVEGMRSKARQQELFAQGRTTKGNIVTKVDGITIKSKHQIGKAVDVCPYINGKLDWNNIDAFIKIGQHVKETAEILGIKISWGGDWKGSWDKPHFELK